MIHWLDKNPADLPYDSRDVLAMRMVDGDIETRVAKCKWVDYRGGFWVDRNGMAMSRIIAWQDIPTWDAPAPSWRQFAQRVTLALDDWRQVGTPDSAYHDADYEGLTEDMHHGSCFGATLSIDDPYAVKMLSDAWAKNKLYPVFRIMPEGGK